MQITPIGEYVLIKKVQVEASNGTSLALLNTGEDVYEVMNPGDSPIHKAGEKVLIDDQAHKISAGNGSFLVKKEAIVAIYGV